MSEREIISPYKNWMKYENYLLTGEWHIHTNYTDGKNSVDEYCKRAVALGIPLIAFTEHVRKELTYNYQNLEAEIITARENYPNLIILTGCEAKVLEGGSLDVSEEVLKQSEIVLMAFHSFLASKDKYVEALKVALSDPGVDIWAHPGLFLRNFGLTLKEEEVVAIHEIASRENVLIERNDKYCLPCKDWVEIGKRKGVKFVHGGDVHSVKELK